MDAYQEEGEPLWQSHAHVGPVVDSCVMSVCLWIVVKDPRGVTGSWQKREIPHKDYKYRLICRQSILSVQRVGGGHFLGPFCYTSQRKVIPKEVLSITHYNKHI